jgi:poly-gamma-glutamate synthesis protein (capsule biosynthesis protein)
VNATLLLAGDVMLQRPPGAAAAELLRSADQAFVNLEVVLTDGGEPADKMICLRADPSLAAEVARLGATVATVANNHALDFGWPALAETVECLERAGVRTVGAGVTSGEALRPAVVEAGGLRIGFLGLACTLPNGSSAAPRRPGIAGIRVVSSYVVDAVTADETPGTAPFVETEARPEDVELAVEAVRSARADVDALVVGIHWGVPVGWMAGFQGTLATYQRPLGHALVDAGADVVAGHHAHTLHGVELYRGRPILYSLGNFLFHALFDEGFELARPYPPYRLDTLSAEEGRETAVARVVLGGNGDVSVELLPLLLDERGEPGPASDDRGRAILERVDAMSRELGTRVEVGAAGQVSLAR